MTVDFLVARLRAAEMRLNRNLSLLLEPDGSGEVLVDREEGRNLIFRFDRITDLAFWLSAPREVAYDRDGREIPRF